MSKTKFKQTEIGMIPEDWEAGKLKDYLFIKGRIGWKGLKKSEFGEEGIIIINGPEIKNGKVNWGCCLRVPEWRYQESKEIMVKEKDIIMTKDGTIGKVAFINKLPEPATLASGIFLIRSESQKLNQNFLYQYFNSNFFKHIVESRIEGSVIPHLYQRDIEELHIPLPPILEQKSIAKILSDLDSKIELNQQMNKTLETAGQAIFKRWFVDFEFPNEKGKTYKSSGGEMVYNEELGKEIPEEWEVGKLGGIGKIQPGFAFKSKDFQKEGVGLVKIRNIQNSLIDLNFESYISKEIYDKIDKKFHLKSGDILIAMTGAKIGKIGIIPKIDKVFLLNQRVGKVDSEMKYLLYLILISSKIQGLIKGGSSASSAQENISNSDIESFDYILPTKDVLNKLSNILDSLFAKFIYNSGQNIILSQIRDSLLPRLMSGKIRVPVEAK